MTTTKPRIGTSGEPGHGALTEDALERELDEALQETFPASDPIAITQEDEDEPARSSEEDRVDQALEDTFPASDPPAPAHPGKK